MLEGISVRGYIIDGVWCIATDCLKGGRHLGGLQTCRTRARCERVYTSGSHKGGRHLGGLFCEKRIDRICLH